MGPDNNQLRIGRRNRGTKQNNTRPKPGCGVQLQIGVFRAQFNGMRAFSKLADPLRLLGKQAPVVGDADRVNRVEMRPRIGREVNQAVSVVTRGYHRGDAHVKIGVGLAL